MFTETHHLLQAIYSRSFLILIYAAVAYSFFRTHYNKYFPDGKKTIGIYLLVSAIVGWLGVAAYLISLNQPNKTMELQK
jgi:hypothetical protein